VIEAKQRRKGEPWIRNDRLLAIATHAHTHAHIKALDGLRPHLLDEIEAFFETYNAQRKLLDEAAAAFQRQNGQPT